MSSHMTAPVPATGCIGLIIIGIVALVLAIIAYAAVFERMARGL